MKPEVPNQTQTESDALAMKKCKLVLKIQKREPFNYEPFPEPDAVQRSWKPFVTLDENGTAYEGEWDLLGRKDGKGVMV